jgi:hypothetical protein
VRGSANELRAQVLSEARGASNRELQAVEVASTGGLRDDLLHRAHYQRSLSGDPQPQSGYENAKVVTAIDRTDSQC